MVAWPLLPVTELAALRLPRVVLQLTVTPDTPLPLPSCTVAVSVAASLPSLIMLVLSLVRALTT
ncbi:hypothetical protein D3C81_1874390 [compost metagenome]